MKTNTFQRLAIILLLVLCFNGASAQKWSKRNYELHAGVGVTNFMGDVCSPRDPEKMLWILPFRTTGLLADGMLKYNVKGRHFVSTSLNIGYMAARETIEKQTNYWYRHGIAFRSGFAELGFRYEFEFIKERVHKTVYRKLGETKLKNFTMPSYLFAGVGAYYSYGLFYWNDTPGRNRYSKSYHSFAPVVMLGVGSKVRIARNMYVGAEFGLREVIGDNVDGVDGGKDRQSQTPSGLVNSSYKFGKWIDQYQFVSVNIAFKFREKRNHLPNFKTIRN